MLNKIGHTLSHGEVDPQDTTLNLAQIYQMDLQQTSNLFDFLHHIIISKACL